VLSQVEHGPGEKLVAERFASREKAEMSERLTWRADLITKPTIPPS